MKTFLEKVLEVKKDLSETAFARALGMNQKTVNLYMNGERKPSLEFVKNICSNFGVSSDWLLGLPTAGGGPSVNAGSGAAVNIGSGSATAGGDCSKCQLMADHIRQITGRG